MKLSRQVGTTNEVLQVFVQNATVTTGAGLANVFGSTVSFSWFRNDQTAASTGTASTAGSMGVYSTSAWVQVSSTNALGWYQFGAPNGLFASGRSAAVHFYGAPNMAALPVEIELTKTDNQTYVSSQAVGNVLAQVSSNIYRVYSQDAVTSAAGVFRVSTQALATTSNANLLQVYGVAVVTSAAGQLRVSTQALLTTTNANVLEVYGSPIVTSAAGILNVSTQTLAAAGSDIQTVHGQPIVTTAAGVLSVDLRTIHGSGAVTSAAGQLRVSTQAIPTTTAANVVQFYAQPVATSAAGVLRVSTQALVSPDNSGIANISSAVLNPMTESYRDNSSTGTMAQLMYEMIAHMGEASINGTTKTINSIDHSTQAATFTLDSSSAPTSITRSG